MSRVEIYKQKRNFKRKVKLVIFVFIFFILIGISVADYSVNSLMKNDNHIEIVSLKNDNDYYVFDLMGKKIHINISRIKKDIEKVESIIKNML